MVGRAAHKSIGLLRPSLQGLAALNQFIVIARHLPTTVDPAGATLGQERHQLNILGRRLVIVQHCSRVHCIAERRMGRDVIDKLPIQVNSPPVPERLDVLRSCLASHWSCSRSYLSVE